MKLPEGFYNVSSDDFAGGVELAFMSTSLDINVATEYAMRGTTKDCTILEMPFDGASRGAGVQSLSQVSSSLSSPPSSPPPPPPPSSSLLLVLPSTVLQFS